MAVQQYFLNVIYFAVAEMRQKTRRLRQAGNRFGLELPFVDTTLSCPLPLNYLIRNKSM